MSGKSRPKARAASVASHRKMPFLCSYSALFQFHRYAGSSADRTVKSDCAMMQLHNFCAQCQPKPSSIFLPGAHFVPAIKGLCDVRQSLRGMPCPLSATRIRQPSAVISDTMPSLPPRSSAFCALSIKLTRRDHIKSGSMRQVPLSHRMDTSICFFARIACCDDTTFQ